MAHVRTGIRKALITAVTGLTTTGANVYNWNLHAADSGKLPCLSVMVGANPETKSADVENEYGSIEARDLPVTIEVRVAQDAASDQEALLDTTDLICAEVETALNVDETLGGLVLRTRIDSTEVEVSGDGERPITLAKMEWTCIYSVNSAAPSA